MGLKTVFLKVKEESPVLYRIGLINLLGALVCIPLLIFDDRTLMGVNIWVKPFKFLISVGIYILTVGYFITFYPFSKLKKDIVRNLVAWTLLFENTIVVTQATRGVQSHYNTSTALDGILFGLMGILIAINVTIMAFFVIETLRLRLKTTRPVQWAILAGWIIALYGSWIGGQMIGQMAHNVGIEDGGPGLPLLNWSTLAGDYRIGHFFGLHALQLIPLFAYFLGQKVNWKARKQTLAVVLFSLIYVVWISFTFFQAAAGKPLIAN